MPSDTIPPFAIPRSELASLPPEEPVWPEGLPGFAAGPGPVPGERDDSRGATHLDRFFGNIQVPGLYAYPAATADNTGAAVLVCPGGGYTGVAIDKEGHDLARFFNSFGVSAFVLKYRVPAPDDQYGRLTEAPLRDAQRALRLIRARAGRHGINPERVGIMGFSSGGHLAATAATLSADAPEQNPAWKGFSARPDFTILVYPVITITQGFMHTGSRLRLLGPDPDPALVRRFSPETQVTQDTPPCLLIQTGDDSVAVQNSIAYYQALQQAGVPAEMHLYAAGGHGYGMKKRGLPIDAWTDRLREWFASTVLARP